MCLQQGGVTPLSPSVRDAFFFCCFLVTFAVVGRQECRPAFAMHSFFVAFLVTFAVVGRQGVSPLLELLSLCYSKLAKVANCVCNKEGRHSCRPAFAMHSFFVAFLVTFAAVGRQECRPSLSCFYYCCSY